MFSLRIYRKGRAFLYHLARITSPHSLQGEAVFSKYHIFDRLEESPFGLWVFEVFLVKEIDQSGPGILTFQVSLVVRKKGLVNCLIFWRARQVMCLFQDYLEVEAKGPVQTFLKIFQR